jgi:hypothetical protein
MTDIAEQRREIIEEFRLIAEQLRNDGVIPPA